MKKQKEMGEMKMKWKRMKAREKTGLGLEPALGLAEICENHPTVINKQTNKNK